MWLWTLDEYFGAIKNDEVFQRVSRCLDALEVLPNEMMPRAAMIESQYYSPAVPVDTCLTTP